MRAEALRELMDGVESADVTEEAKAVFRQLIHNVAADYRLTIFEHDEQIAFAQHLLRNCGEPRAVIRDRLIVRYGISRSTAYRIIEESMQLSQKPALFGTPDWLNGYQLKQSFPSP